MHHELPSRATTNPLQEWLVHYLHQLEFALVILAMFYFLYRYRQEMFAVFKKPRQE